MSDQIATYTFLPWLRQGIANQLNAPAGNAIRATIDLDLKLTAQLVEGGTDERTINQQIAVYGPGDVVGIDKKAIVKVEPKDYITNFEPNYLPYIEFYDEDLPWRYSPDNPDSLQRLTPWIMLIVLTEDEFEEIKNIQDRPLSAISVKSLESAFPPADQLWAWAHVHVNRGLDSPIRSENVNTILDNLGDTLNENPDLAYSRIVCPRKLDEKTAYHAFLVPVFESGRLAGLGKDPNNAPDARHSAWADYEGREEGASFPYYHRWFFQTGSQGDFEYLVRLLEPKPANSKVGNRDMDVQDPGSNITGIQDEELGGVLWLQGALRVPVETLKEEEREEFEKYDNWADPYPHPFQQELAAFINLTDDYARLSAPDANNGVDEDMVLHDNIQNDPDPLITPPLYARWHALTQRLLRDADGNALSPDDNWVHELNLDPRWRVAAGFGTKIVQENQEDYMEAAWKQIGDVLAANRRIRLAQLAKETAFSWHQKHLQPLQAVKQEKFIMLAQPVQKRVISEGLTVYHQFNTSQVALSPASLTMRRVMSPRGRVMRSLEFTGAARPDNFLARINAGEVDAAPPKTVPAGVPTVNEVSDELVPENVPDWWVDLSRRFPWLRYAPLVLALIILLLFFVLPTAGIVIGLLLIAGLIYLYFLFSRWDNTLGETDIIREDNQTPESVDDLPKSPDFRISQPGEDFTPTAGATDSPEAVRFKTALRDTYSVIQASDQKGRPPGLRDLNFTAIANATLQKTNPVRSIPAFTLNAVRIPPRILDQLTETFQEAMAYPEFDIPMYKPLVELSEELFLPNINLVEQNSITLLETNQRFIESYMVGLNHEFGRELLWREYVTDQRGSYFRQFWDVSTFLADAGEDAEELREKLRDIPELHRWSRFSNLGDHDHREQGSDNEEELVLVIRGELLKKYPTAVIYAHRAEWQRDEEGDIDNTKERILVELTEAQEENPPKSIIKTPLYEAKVEPDIYFFGFDLTAEQARGGTGAEPGDDPGWFFVIKERPGEPRFGLDLNTEPDIDVWNDLSWENVLPGAPSGAFLTIDNETPTINVTEPEGDEDEKQEQHDDDVHITWSKDMNAAELAYVLYQVPVLVGIHAAEMLPRE